MPDQAKAWADDRKGKIETEGLYKANVPCSVDPKIGVLFHDGRVLWGTSDLPERERSPLFLAHRKSAARHIPEAILLHHVFGDNYFHFFMFIMNKVWLVEQFGLPRSIPFLVNEASANTPFFRQAEAMGAFFGRNVIIQGRREIVKVDQPYLALPFFCDGETMTWTADVFRGDTSNKTAKPVFAIRSSTAPNGRLFRNQKEVSRLAESTGFEVLDPATMSLKEQAIRFVQAPVIAGAHGAALTNMIFRAGKPTGIIELFSPSMGSPHYAMMAREFGFCYRSTLTKNPEGRTFTASTEVDLVELEKMFDDMLAQVQT
ncbi:glycosyltransferase family 61 protein [Roseibium sp.]|uniref:glycosyltransferase family 61 protein n=1 Tax=Roseibium sp. TaxID=1936156 RepID=UPI003D0B9EB1